MKRITHLTQLIALIWPMLLLPPLVWWQWVLWSVGAGVVVEIWRRWPST